MLATVFPSFSSRWLIYDSRLNSMASFSLWLVSSRPFTPNIRNRSLVMLVWPLKYRDSAPRHREWSPRHSSRSVSSVYSGIFIPVNLPVFLFHQPVQVGQDGIFLRGKAVEVRAVVQAKPLVQPQQQNLQRVQVSVGKPLVRPEEVFQVGDVLREARAFPECRRSLRIIVLFPTVAPGTWLQRVDDISPFHQIQVTAAQVFRQFPIFLLWIEPQYRLAAFPEVG